MGGPIDRERRIRCRPASPAPTGSRSSGRRPSPYPSGSAVKNVEIIREIDHTIARRPGPVRFRWVRGHIGNYFNEQADALADALAGAAARKAAATSSPAARTVAQVAPAAPNLRGAREGRGTGDRSDRRLRE
ncbi:RNase H family protein [Nocardia sp. NPDC001965]